MLSRRIPTEKRSFVRGQASSGEEQALPRVHPAVTAVLVGAQISQSRSIEKLEDKDYCSKLRADIR